MRSSGEPAADDIRRLQEKAAELADHLVLALEAGELGTWQWDRSTDVTTWDETLTRLFGLKAGEFDGSFDAWASLLDPDDVEPTVAAFFDAVGNHSTYEVEHRVVWPDGSVHWLHVRGKITVGEDGQATGLIGCTSDVTDRKQIELERELRVVAAETMAQRERVQRERVEFFSLLHEAVISAPNHQELLSMVTEAAVPRLGDWCTLHFVGEPGAPTTVGSAHTDPEKVGLVNALHERYPYDPRAPTGVAAVIRSGEPELVQLDDTRPGDAIDAFSISNDEAGELVRRLHAASIITVPLVTKRGAVGAMQFVRAGPGRRYGDDDFALAKAAAGNIASAIDNAWLNEQHRDFSSTLLQRALLPVGVPPISDVTVAVRYWAAGTVNEVGGDFYDIFQIGADSWAVVIGDVCGTGPIAAAVTAKARHTIRAAAMHGVEHREVLRWVNDAVLASERDRFVTALYTTLERVDAAAWKMRSVAGGHPLPLLVTKDGTVSRIGAWGTVLGTLPNIRLSVGETALAPGDTVVLYTDGVTDVRPPYQLDDAALGELVAGAAAVDGSAEDVADEIGRRITEILPIPERGDDVALVVVRISG